MSKEIKSSIELAMEKVAKLPRLTQQELRDRHEREYGPLGKVIARRFLAGDLDRARAEAELFRHPEDRGEIVRAAFLEALCQSIDEDDAQVTAKAIEGIRVLLDDAAVDAAARRLYEIFRDCERRKQRERAAAEEAATAAVRDLGISGSAIRLNLEESESWRRVRGELRRELRPELDEIRRELTDEAARSPSQRQTAETPGG